LSLQLTVPFVGYLVHDWASRYAGERGPAPHDVDVLVIGTPDRDEVYEAARRAQGRLGREVNPTIRKPEQWHGAQDGFARQLRTAAATVPAGSQKV
jgi:hypothetical protein